MTVGKLIRQQMVKIGLKQKDLAHALGYNNGQFVSNWCRDVSTPPPKAIPKIAEMLQIKPEKIYVLMEKEYSRKLRQP